MLCAGPVFPLYTCLPTWLGDGQYFLVQDVSEDDDKLATLSQFSAPNVREASQGFPVYGLGQPTMNSVNDFIRTLKDRGKQVRLHCDHANMTRPVL